MKTTNLGDDANHDTGDELRVFEKQGKLHEAKEPQKDEYTGGPRVDDVPDDEAGDHPNKGTDHAAKEAEDGLAGGCSTYY